MARLKAYGDCEGPFGFPMKSVVAQEIERIWNELPKEVREVGYKRKSAEVKGMEFVEGERADVSLITSDAIDADNEVMNPKGGSWDRFQKAGMPVTWNHDYKIPPIGRGLWVQKRPHGWLGKTQYITKPDFYEGNWFPDVTWWYVQNGYLRGKSIGFLPIKVRQPDAKDIEKRPDLKNARLIHEEWIALEWSVPPIQSNPDALVQATAKAMAAGYDSTRILEDAGLLLPSEVLGLDLDAIDEPEPETKTIAAEVKHFITESDVRAWVKAAHAKIDIKDIVQSVFDRHRGRL